MTTPSRNTAPTDASERLRLVGRMQTCALYNFDSVEMVECKHALWNEIATALRIPVVAADRNAVIEECAQLIESGAGMADLIDQEKLDQQAAYIRALTTRSQP